MELIQFSCNDFSMAVPSNWGRKAILSFIQPAGGDFQQSLVVTQDPLSEPISVAEYVKNQQEELKSQLPGFKLEEERVVDGQGLSVPTIRYSWSPEGGKPITQLQAFFVTERLAWTLTATAEKGKAGEVAALFFSTVQSFTAHP